jgi:glycosyltransferase Alg8
LAFLLIFLSRRGVAVPGGRKTLFAFSVIGVWRLGWLIVNATRALVYQRRRFPQLRQQADALGEQGRPTELYVLVTSYKMKPEVTRSVFQALFAEAAAYACPTTIVVSLASQDEAALVKDLFERSEAPASLALVLQIQRGIGKRDAMAEILRSIARRRPAPGAVVAFMDGDTLVTPRTLAKCLPLFRSRPDLGALTTDERAITGGSIWAREWFDLRFAQRHTAMSSVSLSDRVLTLTGRLSFVRAELALCKSFIEIIEKDILNHWRHGRIELLTGDDKSTWFWVLRAGWAMLYVPDVQVFTYDELPSDGFFSGSTKLMVRWFGNTLRNNSRALALGPRRMGFFTWWSILDQRLSIWTALSGPAFALLAALRSPALLFAYALWVLTVKGTQTAVIGGMGRRFSPFFPFLLFYNQVAGSLVKVHISFRLDQQRWTRQKISGATAVGRWRRIRREATTLVLQGMALATFALVVAGSARMLKLPPAWAASGVSLVAGAVRTQEREPGELERLIQSAPRGAVVQLEPREYRLAAPLVIDRDEVTLRGAGPGKTILVGSFPGHGEALIMIQGETPAHVPARERRRLAQPTRETDRAIALAPDERGLSFAPGDHLSIRADNDAAFLAALGAKRWNRLQPKVRHTLVEVERVEGGTLFLARPVGVAFPAGAEVLRVRLRKGVAVRDLTVRYDLGGQPSDALYVNSRPHNLVDGIAVIGAAGTEIENVEVLSAGRHPLIFDEAYEPRVRRVSLVGAWNKGAGGNGYLRIARTFFGSFESVKLRGLRHLTFQWSSHDNSLSGLDADCDVNFHGGYSQRNKVQFDRLEPRANHPWPQVSSTADDAGWAPPDGEGNVVVDSGGVALAAGVQGGAHE